MHSDFVYIFSLHGECIQILSYCTDGEDVLCYRAGVAGLAATKQCLEEGITPVCFDKDSDIGGLWHYREEASDDTEPGMYNSCNIITSKAMTCYSDFLIPREFPNFMHHSNFKRYLDLYADNFKLRKHIRLQTRVEKVERADTFPETGQWMVNIRDLKTDKISRTKFDFVMVCNGHLTEPKRPTFPGLDKFKGRVIHTHNFKDCKGYENLNVLVIGIGHSASDVACELSRHAKHVFVSTKSGTYCKQRAADQGKPFDYLAVTRFRQKLPVKLMRPYHFSRINQRYNHKNYGIAPNFKFDSAHVIVSDDLPNRILFGRITIHTNVAQFTENGAIFDDGSKIDDIDVVILGTGYVYSFPFLDDSIIKMEGHFSYLFKHVWPTDLNPTTLAVIGLVQPVGPVPPVLEMQARWAAHVFAGRNSYPACSQRLEVVENWRAKIKEKNVDAARYSTQIYFIQYMDSVAEFIGCKPNLWKLFFRDFNLWYRVVFCGATPPQWRLDGPGKWAGARRAIETVEENMWFPMQTRESGDGEANGLYEGWIELFKKCAVLILPLMLLKVLLSNVYHIFLGEM